MWLWMWACKPDAGVTALTIEVTRPSDVAPLVRRLHAEADAPVTLAVEWSSDDHAVSTAFAAGAEVQDHTLLGMRPGRTYTLTVTATDANGGRASASETFTTDAAPDSFPVGEIIGGVGERQPGDTLVPMHSFAAGLPTNNIAAIWDGDGQLVYWLDTDEFIYDVQEYDGGLLALVGDADNRLVHYAWDGTEIESWGIGPASGATHLVPATDAHTFHHDVGASRFASGQFLGLGRWAEAVSEYPVDYENPDLLAARNDVALDAVLSFDQDGSVLDELPISDLIPVTHIGFDSLSLTIEGWTDWAHANAVIEDDDQNWIVSLRHLDVVLKVDRTTHEVMWLLGNHENWPADLQGKLLAPVGDLQWQYHQHGPEIGPRGPNGEIELFVFDNGNGQASPFTGTDPINPARSRVVQFEIDEAAMTVRQVWSFDTPAGGRLYSEAVGNADPLENGNVLSAWGFLGTLPDGTANGAAGLGQRSVRVIEIDPATVAEVEELYLTTAKSANDKGWTGYRAERIPTLLGRVVD